MFQFVSGKVGNITLDKLFCYQFRYIGGEYLYGGLVNISGMMTGIVTEKEVGTETKMTKGKMTNPNLYLSNSIYPNHNYRLIPSQVIVSTKSYTCR